MTRTQSVPRVRAIWGVFRTDGVAVEPEQLAAMGARVPVPDPGPVRTWTSAGVGFGWLGGPELVAGGADLALVADGCLHDRQGLIGALGLPAEEATSSDDAELILRAYRHWDTSSPAQLVGDFAFALFDRKRDRLLLARDPFGARPLSLYRRDGLVVFGTWIQSVLVHPDVPRRINEARIGDYFIDALEALDATTTFYEGVERHPPAHTLVVEPGSQKIERYWRLALDSPLAGCGAEEQIAGLREVLSRAVVSRLDAVPGAGILLSGGVDSIAVACLAREHRSRRGRGNLPAFTGVLSDPDMCTEGPYARAVVAQGGFAPSWTHPEDVPRYASALRRVIESTEDLFDVSMLELRTVLFAEAARQGVPMLLDGVDGNLVVSHDAEGIGYLVRGGRWATAWGVAGRLAEFYGIGRNGLLWNHGFRTLRPDALARVKRRLFSSDPQAALVRESLASEDLARRVGLVDRVRRRIGLGSATEQQLLHDSQAYHRHNLESPMIPAAAERYARAAAYQGLESTHPFLDRRVVAYALSLPFETKLHGGWPKGALREALSGSAPAEALWRRPAHNLSTDFWRATLVACDDLLADLERAPLRDVGQFADLAKADKALVRWRQEGCVISGARAFRVAVLASWLHRRS